MKELGTALGGIGLLIFGYLALTHSQGVVQIAEGISQSSTGIISTLQGNSAGAGYTVA